MKISRLLLLLLAISMVLLTFGCGESPAASDPDDPESTAETPGEQPETADEAALGDQADPDPEEEITAAFEDWEAPVSLQELVSRFREIRHTIIQAGEEMITIHYLYEGTESIGGVQTDRAKFDLGDETFTVWLDNTGSFKKIEIGGEEVPPEMAGMFAEPLLASVIMPFQTASGWNVRDLTTRAHQEPGVSVRLLGTTNEVIGDLSATVYRYEVKVEPPAVSPAEAGTMQWRIADFGHFQTIVGWEQIEGGSGQQRIEFRIDRIVLR